jgi:methionine sulfoxide reductase heme-binding subunit
MSIGYTWVQWSRPKRIYDAIAAGAIIGYLAVFIATGKLLWRGEHAISDEILLIRAAGSCAFVLLHAILCIGPLARLDARMLPILFNRRHLGVMTFIVALTHAGVAIGYYHGFGVINPFLSLLTSNTNFLSFRAFPFELLGGMALAILFLLASTSHDFWLKNLGPRTWKSLHMLVYPAYALLVGHVALGALQGDRGWIAPTACIVGLVLVVTLHLAAGLREVRRDADAAPAVDPEHLWLDAGPAMEIPEDRARTLCTRGGERIAVFRYQGGVSAVTNLCAHQGGPLGEGEVIDGCITCPWHGWQYRPHDGCSPPPFQERIATYDVRIVAGRVHVKATPNAPGTPTAPARIDMNTEVARA